MVQGEFVMGRKGTVLYIGGFELPDKNAAAQRVLANAQILDELDFSTIFVGISKETTVHKSILNTHYKLGNHAVYEIQYPRNSREWISFLTNASPYIDVAESVNDLKAIICYNFPSLVLRKVKRYCSCKRILCIADVTEWYSGLGRSVPIKVIKGMDTFYRMRLLHKKMDGLIVISKYLEKYYHACDNVVNIPPLNSLNLRQRPKVPDDLTLKLVYAGSPGLKDRIDLLIESIPFVKRPVTLDIIGINMRDYLSLHPEHKRLDFADNIVFHGRLPHEEAIEYIQKSDYSCFLRYQDRVTMAGFPTKFSEAISLGTPVITNESSNISDYIKPGENGIIVNNLKPQTIAAVIDNAPKEMPVDRNLFSYVNYKKDFQKVLSAT